VCVLTLYLNALDLTHYIIQTNSHFVMKLEVETDLLKGYSQIL